MCSKASYASLNELLGGISYLSSYAYTLLCMYVCVCMYIYGWDQVRYGEGHAQWAKTY